MFQTDGRESGDDGCGLILFAHGSSDPNWRVPFEAIAGLVRQRHPGPVSLAFLERMSPALADAAVAVASRGAKRAVLVPLFLGVGRHLREDLPSLAAEAASAAGIPIAVSQAAGQADQVVAALAAFCIAAATGSETPAAQG